MSLPTTAFLGLVRNHRKWKGLKIKKIRVVLLCARQRSRIRLWAHWYLRSRTSPILQISLASDLNKCQYQKRKKQTARWKRSISKWSISARHRYKRRPKNKISRIWHQWLQIITCWPLDKKLSQLIKKITLISSRHVKVHLRHNFRLKIVPNRHSWSSKPSLKQRENKRNRFLSTSIPQSRPKQKSRMSKK